MTAKRTAWLGAPLLALLAGVGCSAGDDGEAALHSGRALWSEAEPDEYVVQTCTVGVEPPGCARVAVRDGEVVAAQDQVYAGGSGWEESMPDQSPVLWLFAQVEAGGDDECMIDDVEYDETYGFVASYTSCGGAGTGQRVVCFEPATVALDARVRHLALAAPRVAAVATARSRP
jgi:hypothetical protein